jgi:ribosomal-protein-alanine N-acetyltransferase
MQLTTALPGIILRPLRADDADVMAHEANSTRIFENVRDLFPFPYRPDHARAFIDAQAQKQPTLHFAITDRDTLIGVIGYAPQEDVYRFSAEIGYWLGESHWGRGIASTAIQTLVDHIFRHTDILRVYAGVFAFNTASMRALEKAGFEKEGVFKNHVFKNARFWNEHHYYRLKPDAFA